MSTAGSVSGIKKTKPVFVKVESLTPDSKGDNLIVKVVELKVILERTNMDGSTLRIGEALVGDETGTILLTCRNDQLADVSVGNWLYIRNSKIEMYLGHMRLHVDRWGLIETVPVDQQPKENVNTDAQKNLSNAKFELVDITT